MKTRRRGANGHLVVFAVMGGVGGGPWKTTTTLENAHGRSFSMAVRGVGVTNAPLGLFVLSVVVDGRGKGSGRKESMSFVGISKLSQIEIK